MGETRSHAATATRFHFGDEKSAKDLERCAQDIKKRWPDSGTKPMSPAVSQEIQRGIETGAAFSFRIPFRLRPGPASDP